MQSVVHLVRHGQVHNPDGILYGRLPGYGLSEIGRAMAQRLGEHFADVPLTHLRCSPLQRAQETMAPIAANHPDLDIVTDQRVIEARSQVQSARETQNIGALGEAEGALRMGLGRLFAIAEAYPELKSNEHFMQLQQRITSLENGIADRRELYNDAVNINNVRVEQFPDAVIARLFNFEIKPLLEFSTAEKADVDLKQLFG